MASHRTRINGNLLLRRNDDDDDNEQKIKQEAYQSRCKNIVSLHRLKSVHCNIQIQYYSLIQYAFTHCFIFNGENIELQIKCCFMSRTLRVHNSFPFQHSNLYEHATRKKRKKTDRYLNYRQLCCRIGHVTYIWITTTVGRRTHWNNQIRSNCVQRQYQTS